MYFVIHVQADIHVHVHIAANRCIRATVLSIKFVAITLVHLTLLNNIMYGYLGYLICYWNKVELLCVSLTQMTVLDGLYC